ncbi:uncharacterized protein A4U43_C04F24610 [Asparagus officinalis]|uniref:Uncharacterized protein n=1 Tax=Asparagus officinalis TaxID=4686 RepID=A0A5P1F567_ASPOF|nr:uncharacterized protein A4U43_C04F24610 [Asparagus officinalis]
MRKLLRVTLFAIPTKEDPTTSPLDVIIVNDGSPVGERGTEITMVESNVVEASAERETAPDMPAELVHQHEKVLAAEGVFPALGFGWTFPHRIDELDAEK